MAHHQQLGRRGEDAAAEWYRASGHEVIDRNWRSRRGELDLVCRRDGLIVFVEVKARTSDRYGTGFEAVTAKKQRTIRALAVEWLQEAPKSIRGRGGDLRFDVAVVDARGHVQVAKGCF